MTPGPGAGIELEPSAEQVRGLLTAAVDYVLGFLERLPEAALSDTAGVAAVLADEAVRRPPPAGGPAHYMQDLQASELPDFAEYGPELTRAFRGLRLWLPLHLHGVEAFRAALDDKLDLAAHAYRRLSADPLFEVAAAPELSTVAFWLRRGDTAELLRRVNAEQRVVLASTSINGRYTGRICVLNHRTDRARVDEAIAALRRHGAELSSGR